MKRGHALGKQSLAARFIYRRLARIHNRYAKSLLTCRYRRRDPRWPRSDDQDFRACSH
jgi:hypothetical protein